MPAANIMAIQENVENSGASSLRPSLILPNLLNATMMANAKNMVVHKTKAHPKLVITTERAFWEKSEKLVGFSNPQSTTDRTMTTAGMVTR